MNNKLVMFFKSTDTIPYAVLFCNGIHEWENILTLSFDSGDEIEFGEYDYYHTYQIETTTAANVLVEAFDKFQAVLQSYQPGVNK